MFSLTFIMYYESLTSSYGDLQIMKNNVRQLGVYQELDSNTNEGTASGTTVLSLNNVDRLNVHINMTVETCMLLAAHTVIFLGFCYTDLSTYIIYIYIYMILL